MKFAMLLPARYDERKWTLARQVGIDCAITKAMPELSGKPAPYDFDALKSIRNAFAEAGFKLHGLEGDQFDMAPIKLGLPDRDEWIEKYQQMLRNMGALGIPLLCYNFMASIGWMRTRTDVKGRGGALCSAFDAEDIRGETVAEALQIGEDTLWQNLYYFLDAVLPVAEEAGVQMALHPDDPPISPIKGVARILTSASSFDHIISKYPSPANGITFCQATFRLMDEDLKSISRRWIEDKRIFFLHLRDVEGDKYSFRETFHDNGPTDMAHMLEHYHRCGFNGVLRPDHAPTMYGEEVGSFASGTSVGYEMLGKIFAIGYLKGICEAKGIGVDDVLMEKP
jgi:mannonate dehydratase